MVYVSRVLDNVCEAGDDKRKEDQIPNGPKDQVRENLATLFAVRHGY